MKKTTYSDEKYFRLTPSSNFELDRPLPKGKNNGKIWKNGEKIMAKFIGLKTKTFSYLPDDSSEDKKSKKTQKSVT